MLSANGQLLIADVQQPAPAVPVSPQVPRDLRRSARSACCSTTASGFCFPLVIRRAIDDLNRGVTRHKLLTYSLLLLAVAAVKAIFQFLTRWILIGISREIEFDLRNDLFRHLERLSYSFYQRTRTGDIMARATNDLNAVRMLLGPAIMYTANTVVFTAGALVFMLSISPRLTLFAFVPLPVVSIVVQYFGARIHERFERIQAMFSDISARAQENFSGARLIRAYVQEEAEIELFERDNNEYIARSLKLVRLMGMLWPTLETLLGVAIVIVLLRWRARGAAASHDGGQLRRLQYLHGAAHLAGHRAGLGHQHLPARHRLHGPHSQHHVGAAGDHGRPSRKCVMSGALASAASTECRIRPVRRYARSRASDVHGDIEFRNLSFRYGKTLRATESGNGRSHGDEEVLKNINLRVPAGTSLAIVGPTGSGKSTLVTLIPRIYDAAPGSVLIDGRPIREFPLADLRRNIGFVPQETFLFSDTIRENIAFGAEDATPTKSAAPPKPPASPTDIESFPDGYTTWSASAA